MKPLRLFPILLIAFTLSFSVIGGRDASAELRIRVGPEMPDPLPIAVQVFAADDQQLKNVGRQLSDVIAADLQRSGLFRPVDRKAFLTAITPFNVKPVFRRWRDINAEALVTGVVERSDQGRIQVKFRLWDVAAQVDLVGRSYKAPPESWRRISHIIADAIFERLTGEKGYFDTRIVYIAESGPERRRIKRLAIMDQDGANHRFLTQGEDLVLTPRFSPTTQEITYLSYHNNVPRVFLFNIDTGRQEALGDFPGMTFAPRFSPDGNKVVMSLARNGNSEIYTMDLRTRQMSRLTNHRGIDTAPSYAPDGRRVAFESDRSGSQQIYVMSSSGGNARRISFGKGRYATPVWSPRGDLIAFTKILRGEFHIGVMKTDGSGERTIAKGWLVEGPTWAPNGRYLMFFRQNRGGPVRLYSIDLTGHNERLVPTPTQASDPAWSPLIP